VQAVQQFAAAASALDSTLDQLQNSGAKDSAEISKINDQVVQIEREFLDPAGLPKRDWFKHILVAPGYTTGYAAWVLPGIVQALTDYDPVLFDSELKRLVTRISSATAAMQKIVERKS
jgi:N-acetylated-alpha-linked acidic dipeptidase